MTFAKLKELGMTCEFITEQARLYIANKRWVGGIKPETKIELHDSDQVNIMLKQLDIETIVHHAVGEDVIVISDSSPLNALLYMSEARRNDEATKDYIEETIEKSDIVFYCAPILGFSSFDPNRVHDEKFSLEVDSQIPTVMTQYAPQVWNKVYHLTGDANARMHQVVNVILTK